jgi:hypothetical protein
MTSGVAVDGWERAGRLGGYGAAAAFTPYLLIKVSWVVGALAGVLSTGQDMDTAEWVAINTATIGMAAVAIAVSLALVQTWGERIPGRLLVGGSWIGAGFLVPVLPYAFVGLAAGADSGDAMPVWEATFIQAAFVGMGVGLAVAVPAYFRRRWPFAMAGRVGERPLGYGAPVGWSIAVAVGLAGVWTYAGLVGEGAGRNLLFLFAGWSLLAALSVGSLVAGRPADLSRSVVMTVAWLGSGSLFAWNAWKLPLTFVADLGTPAWSHVLGVVAGAVMLRTLLRVREQ